MNRFDNKGILRRAQSMGRGLAFIDFKASKSNVDFLFFRKLKVNFIKIVWDLYLKLKSIDGSHYTGYLNVISGVEYYKMIVKLNASTNKE
jgi:hypothetical protein